MSSTPSKPKEGGKQTVISSYFSQPSGAQSSPAQRPFSRKSSSPIDLTSDNEELPLVKKRKTTHVFSEAQPRDIFERPNGSSDAASMEQYRFGTQASGQSQNPQREAAQRDRHERAKRILLSGINVLDRPTQHDEHDAEDDSDDEPESSGVVAPTYYSMFP